MWISWRNCFAVTLVAVLFIGCGKAVPPPINTAQQTNEQAAPITKQSAETSHSAETNQSAESGGLETGSQQSLPTGVQPQVVLARLDRIDELLARAAKSTLFAEPEPETLVSHKLGPGPGVVLASSSSSSVAALSAATPAATAQPDVPVPATIGYKVVPVSNGGTIASLVSFDGTPRPPKVIKVEKTPEVCGKEDRELYEVSVTDGKLQDVVLFLEEVNEGKPFDNHVLLGPPPGMRGGLDAGENDVFPGTDIKPQKCIFGAFTGVIAETSVLRFDNLDPVKHSPHTYGIKGRVRKSMHNQDLEGKGQLTLPIKLKKGYKILKLECDQHPHMQNWFRVVSNPYYGFSAVDGTCAIDQVPPGTYNMIAWHPILGEQEQEVVVAAGGTVDVSFEFSSKRRR